MDRLRVWAVAFRRRTGRLPTVREAGAGVGLAYGTAWAYAAALETMYGCQPAVAEREALARGPTEWTPRG
ncbi:MAG TPA: hypothetical protein VGF55_17405 [Gemmataceae bacterium]